MAHFYLEQSGQLIVSGTGAPLRQFIYADDLAKLIVWAVDSYIEEDPIILSVDESHECSIKDVAKLIAREFGLPSEKIKVRLKLLV